MYKTFRTAIFAIGFTTLGATAGVTASAIAAPNRGAKGAPGIMKFAYAIGSLDLTEAQKGMLEDLRDEVRSELRLSREGKGDEAQMVSDAVVRGETIDREVLHTVIDETAAARLAMAHKVLDGVLDVYDSLDTEQKTELSEMIREHQAQKDQLKENLGDRKRDRR